MDVLVDLAETAVSLTPTNYHPVQQTDLNARANLPGKPLPPGNSALGKIATRGRQWWGNIAARWLLQEMRIQQTAFNQAITGKLNEQNSQQQSTAQEIALLSAEITNMQHNLTAQKTNLRTMKKRAAHQRKI